MLRRAQFSQTVFGMSGPSPFLIREDGGFALLARCLFAVLVSAAAVAFRLALSPIWGPTTVLLPLFFAVVISSLFWGLIPGLLATVVSILAGAYFFAEPRFSFAVDNFGDLAFLLLFFFVGALCGWLIDSAAKARRELEEEIKRHRLDIATLNGLLRAAPVGIGLFDATGRFRMVNKPLADAHGVPPEDHLGRRIHDVIPGVAGELEEVFRRVIRTGRPVSDYIVTVDDPEARSSKRFFLHNWFPVQVRSGRTENVGAIVQDITEKILIEERLRDALQRLTYLVGNTPLAVIEWDQDWTITRWSGEAEQIFGWRASEVVGRRNDSFRFIHEADMGEVRRVMSELAASGSRFVVSHNRNYTKDGRVIHCEWYNSVLHDASGQIICTLSLALDVTERTQLAEALHSRLEELAAVDRRKDEFIATLAHELRNPLAPLAHAVRILRSPHAPAALHTEALDIMERQIGQQVRLIDELLDLSRIRTGKVVLQRETVDLRQAIDLALETSLPHLKARQHVFSLNVPPVPIVIEGDRTRLAQIFSNLLNNAAKFTPSGGRVSLSVSCGGGTVAVTVRDTGKGIEPERLNEVFEMFSQGGGPPENSRGGLGIGLHLVRRLVELHGGTVTATSPGPGYGSEFIVTLPASLREVDKTGETRLGPVESGKVRLRVLVVDDNVDAAASLAMVLRLSGHEVCTAHDGPSGLSEAGRFRPELILLDIGLPGMSGLEVAAKIREAEKNGEHVPLVALTGWGQDADKERSKAAGFDRHLTKPIDAEALEAIIIELTAGPSNDGLPESGTI